MKKSKILIDGDYLYHLIKRFKIKIDFNKFYDLLNKSFGQSVIYYYSSTPLENKKRQQHISFLDHLSKFGYHVKRFNLTKAKSGEIYSSNIDVQIVLDALEGINEYHSIILISGDSDFVSLFKSIKDKKKDAILIGMPSMTSRHLISESTKFYNLRKFFSSDFINKPLILNNVSDHVSEEVYTSTEKEKRFRDEIKEKLKTLKSMIVQKKTETELHNYLKENELIPTPFIQHEFQSIIQNRQDFLIKNEFGEFEIWELKSPNIKLFEGEISKDVVEKYKKLKLISKTSELVKAIEQLSIYKKEFIDGNVTHPNFNDNLKENIYNAKLMLVIGSSNELISDVYLEKLNLERYMLNNLNIITWEMFYKKIENYYKQLINN